MSQWHDLNCKLAGMHGFEACRRFIGPGEFPANWGYDFVHGSFVQIIVWSLPPSKGAAAMITVLVVCCI